MSKGYAFIPYLVEPGSLQKTYGSDDPELFAGITSKFKAELDDLTEMIYAKKAGLQGTDFLQTWLAGETEKHPEQGHAYVYLQWILAKHLGSPLSCEYWNPGYYGYEIWENWQQNFVLYFPFGPPNEDPTAAFNYFPQEQIGSYLEKGDFKPIERVLAQDNSPEFQQAALSEYKSWFIQADEQKKDLCILFESLYG